MSSGRPSSGDAAAPGRWTTAGPAPAGACWGHFLLRAEGLTIREATPDDAKVLIGKLSGPDRLRLIGSDRAAADTLEERFAPIPEHRAGGREICLVVVPNTCSTAVGFFRVREVDPGFITAEWDFGLAEEHWGTGLFVRSAPPVVDLVFDVLGALRLEARAMLLNGRAIGALRKLGAVQEGLLRRAGWTGDQYVDQSLWAILADDWRRRTGRGPVH